MSTCFLADGVLLGSASSTKNSEVQMVVFIALVVHKVTVFKKTLFICVQTFLGSVRFCTLELASFGEFGALQNKKTFAYILIVCAVWCLNYLLFARSGKLPFRSNLFKNLF